MTDLESKEVEYISAVYNKLVLLSLRLHRKDIKTEMYLVICRDLQIPVIDIHFDVGSSYCREIMQEEVAIAFESVQ